MGTPKMARPEAEAEKNGHVLLVTNLPKLVAVESLARLFATLGPVDAVRIMCDPQTGTPRSAAVVCYVNACDAMEAVERLHNAPFGDRLLEVSVAPAYELEHIHCGASPSSAVVDGSGGNCRGISAADIEKREKEAGFAALVCQFAEISDDVSPEDWASLKRELKRIKRNMN